MDTPQIAPSAPEPAEAKTQPSDVKPNAPQEVGGSKKLEPTRYGDWEMNGRCIDF